MRSRTPHKLQANQRSYTVPAGWFRTMLSLCHIELRGTRKTEARLAPGRTLRVSAEGTLQIVDVVPVGYPVPISRIYQMGERVSEPSDHFDFGLAQATPEFPVEQYQGVAA